MRIPCGLTPSHPITFISLTDISSRLCHSRDLADSPPSHIAFPTGFPFGPPPSHGLLPADIFTPPYRPRFTDPSPSHNMSHEEIFAAQLAQRPLLNISYVPALNSTNLH